MNLPQRKLQRLKNYDYSQNNAYSITMCTQNKLHLFGYIADHLMILNNAGKMVAEKILNISDIEGIDVNKFIIMPNHIHAIIIISQSGTTQGSFPTLSQLVQQFKMITTKLYIDGVKKGDNPSFDKKIWQKSYHDHIIRDEEDYQTRWNYIDTNPARWAEDEYNNIAVNGSCENP